MLFLSTILWLRIEKNEVLDHQALLNGTHAQQNKKKTKSHTLKSCYNMDGTWNDVRFTWIISIECESHRQIFLLVHRDEWFSLIYEHKKIYKKKKFLDRPRWMNDKSAKQKLKQFFFRFRNFGLEWWRIIISLIKNQILATLRRTQKKKKIMSENNFFFLSFKTEIMVCKSVVCVFFFSSCEMMVNFMKW